MSIERSARSRSREARRVLAEIEEMEETFEASRGRESANDSDLDDWADELTRVERDVVTEGTDIDANAVADNQDARANDNWSMTASEKREIAANLTRIARKLA